MARILGVNLPPKKRVEIAVRYIYGIGPTRSKNLCKSLGIADAMRVNELSDADVSRIREYIEANHAVEGDLLREVRRNIRHEIDLGSYRGLRHRKSLPVRGQRTHTNARTRKGKAKPIAGKK